MVFKLNELEIVVVIAALTGSKMLSRCGLGRK